MNTEEGEQGFGPHLLPWPDALVQCMSYATLFSGQTLSFLLDLVIHPWLHSGACPPVTALWLPEPNSTHLPDSSSKELDPGVQPQWPDIPGSNLLFYPPHP